jgi:hypothetical protein
MYEFRYYEDLAQPEESNSDSLSGPDSVPESGHEAGSCSIIFNRVDFPFPTLSRFLASIRELRCPRMTRGQEIEHLEGSTC